MTEKRFQMIGDMRESYIKDNDTGDAYYFNECVQVLNNIAEENRRLKQSLQNKMESNAYWEVKAKERVTELEQRNKNQKRRLEKIHQMVSDENWKGLKLHYKELEEQDEQYSEEERLYYCDGDIIKGDNNDKL